MVDLVLRPANGKDKWALQLRWHENLGETEYRTLCRVDDWTAREIIRAGKADWLFGDPDKETKPPQAASKPAAVNGMTPEQVAEVCPSFKTLCQKMRDRGDAPITLSWHDAKQIIVFVRDLTTGTNAVNVEKAAEEIGDDSRP